MVSDCNSEYDREYINLYNEVCPNRTIDDIIELINCYGRLPLNYSLIDLQPSDNEYVLNDIQTHALAETNNISLFDNVSGLGCDPKELNCKNDMANSLSIIYGFDIANKRESGTYYCSPLRKIRKFSLSSALVGFFDEGSVLMINQMTYDELTDFVYLMTPTQTYESIVNWIKYRSVLPKIINNKMLQWEWFEIDGCMVKGDIIHEIMDLPSGYIPADISIQLIHNGQMERLYIARKTLHPITFADFKELLQVPGIFKYIVLPHEDEYDYITKILVNNHESEMQSVLKLVSLGQLCYSLIDLVLNGLVTKSQYDNDVRVRNIIHAYDKQTGSPTKVISRRLLYKHLNIEWMFVVGIYDPLSLELHDITQEDAINLKMRFISNTASNFGPIDIFLNRYPQLDIKYFVTKGSVSDNNRKALEHALTVYPNESKTANYFFPELGKFMDKPFDKFTSDILFTMFANNYHFDSEYYPHYYVGQTTISQPSTFDELILSLNCVCPVKWKQSSWRIMKQIQHIQKINTIDYQTFVKQLNTNGKQMLDIAMVSNKHIIPNNVFLETWLTSDNGNFELMKDHKQLPEMVKSYL